MKVKILTAFLIVNTVLIGVVAGIATAHQPHQHDFRWTCDLGNGAAGIPGDCYVHHSNANARYDIRQSAEDAGLRPAYIDAHDAWDQTDGHEFDFQRWNDNGNKDMAWAIDGNCGAGVLGCVDFIVDDNDHIVESSGWIEVDRGEIGGAQWWDDVATHEMGHYVGLGHSSSEWATMVGAWSGGDSNLETLNNSDRLGRCQIYGHAHGYWGGC